MISHLDPRNTSPELFCAAASDLGISQLHSRRLFNEILTFGRYEAEEWVKLGVLSQTNAGKIPPLRRLQLESIICSEQDGFRKIIFRTADNLPVETVIIPLHKEGKNTICLSSQVGCVMGCTFCSTAKMSVRRNLETWEILDQFIQARKIVRTESRRVTGAVFMGMGEPFLNYSNVVLAARLLCHPTSDSISGKSITISTVGLVQEIRRYTEEGHKYRLSISLGAATDEKRRRLVPVAARTPLSEVIEAAKHHSSTRGVRMMISYVCISGENVSEEDAEELGRLLHDFPVRLVLIDVNDPSGQYFPPDSEELRRFRDALRRHLGQPVVRRYSGGGDIQAACGTLDGNSLGFRESRNMV